MVQGYVLDRECEKHGITVSEVQLITCCRPPRLTRSSTLEETLTLHP